YTGRAFLVFDLSKEISGHQANITAKGYHLLKYFRCFPMMLQENNGSPEFDGLMAYGVPFVVRRESNPIANTRRCPIVAKSIEPAVRNFL
ncbi:MAG: hypothetical protein OXI60_00845, partial [Acidiferrobacterales bacterium]|nr:hypothetical protein [Acidiferrobacterales bacterium]